MIESKQNEDLAYLDKFIPMVDFLAEILGKKSEVVLNSLHDLDHAVRYIRNAEISHRQVGDAASDLVLNILSEEEKYRDMHFLANYRGSAKDGKVLRSSTFFIRKNARLIGLICINIDQSDLVLMKKQAEALLNLYGAFPEESAEDEGIQEHLISSTKHLPEEMIKEVTEDIHVPINYLKREEKCEIVRKLHAQGYFLLKDAVSKLAEYLQTSEPTIYRYVREVKAEEK